MNGLSIPVGWFQVGWPADVESGSVRTLYYFGRHLVLWRDAEGVAHLNDSHCPHLGAHVGHGGKVLGGSIAWSPLIERNGLRIAQCHPDGDEPTWEIPEVAEFTDAEHDSDAQLRDFHVAAAWQEMAENGAGSAHFGFVHGQEMVPSHGPGFSVVRMTGIIDMVSLGSNTPVSEQQCHLRFSFKVRTSGSGSTRCTWPIPRSPTPMVRSCGFDRGHSSSTPADHHRTFRRGRREQISRPMGDS